MHIIAAPLPVLQRTLSKLKQASRLRLAWRVEVCHQLAALDGGGGAVQAQRTEAAPVEVLFHHVQQPRHGAEQQHLGWGPGSTGGASGSQRQGVRWLLLGECSLINMDRGGQG